jgi:hypothetical protein
MKRMFGVGLLLPALVVVVAALLVLILAGRNLPAARVTAAEVAALGGIAVALAAGWVLTGTVEGRSAAHRLRVLAPGFIAGAIVAAAVFYLHGQVQSREPVPDAYVTWPQYRSRHFLFVHPSDSPLRSSVEAFAARSDERYETIVNKLGVGFDSRITFFAYNDGAQAREMLGRDPGFGDPVALEVHVVCGKSGGPEEAYIIACEGFAQEPKYRLIPEGLMGYLGGEGDEHWSAVVRLLEGRLHPLADMGLEFVYASPEEFRSDAASFTKFLFDTYGSKAFRQFWGARDLDTDAVRAYGKHLGELEAEWHAGLAEMAGFRSLDEFAAAAAERVPLDSPAGREIAALFGAIAAAHRAGDREAADRLLAVGCSPEARGFVMPGERGGAPSEWHVRRITGYAGRCYIVAAAVQSESHGEKQDLAMDVLVAPRLGEMRVLHCQPQQRGVPL